MSMKGKAPVVKALQLAEGEEFVTCPYDMSHQVINHRMITHLLKCRKNYAKKIREEGESVLWLTCKYNWTHQCPAPEIMYHQLNCPDQHNIIQHCIGYVDPRTGSCNTQVYLSKGHSNIFTPYLRAANYPEATQEVMIEGSEYPNLLSTSSNFSAASSSRVSSIDDDELAELPNPLEGYSDFTQQQLKVDDSEDWGLQAEKAGAQSYDPRKKAEHYLHTKYPPNMTKAERKVWKVKNMERAKHMLDLTEDRLTAPDPRLMALHTTEAYGFNSLAPVRQRPKAEEKVKVKEEDLQKGSSSKRDAEEQRRKSSVPMYPLPTVSAMESKYTNYLDKKMINLNLSSTGKPINVPLTIPPSMRLNAAGGYGHCDDDEDGYPPSEYGDLASDSTDDTDEAWVSMDDSSFTGKK